MIELKYNELNITQAATEQKAVQQQFEALKAKNLALNMARGKPSKAQLDMVSDILTVLV